MQASTEMQVSIIPALMSALESVSLLRADGTLLAAVSGGADSVALLCGLHALRRSAGYRLAAVHVEHGLRGADSMEDAAFVQSLCAQLGVPLYLYHAELDGDMDSPAAEERARQARQRLYRMAMEESSADALLLAHHQDDQAETVLMRLLRGAGAQGLSGMRAVQPFGRGLLLRPLLALPSDALKDALRRSGQPWREDESNAKPCCLRNRLRLEIMPLLEECQPHAASHMAEAAQRLACDEDCLTSLARTRLAKAQLAAAQAKMPPWHALRIDSLVDAPKAIAVRVLRLWFEQGVGMGGKAQDDGYSSSGERALSHGDTLRLYALLQGSAGDSLNLPSGMRAERTTHFLHLLRQDGGVLLPPVASTGQPLGSTQLPLSPARREYRLGQFDFTLEPMRPGDKFPDGIRTLPLTGELLARGPVLRNPLKGDTIRPFGASGGKALRRYFTDRKVDAPFRAAWPVLACGQEVLWVAGVGAAEATRLAENAQGFWVLRVLGELPY